jgi:hypothetical protein
MKNLKRLWDKFGDFDLINQFDNFEIYTTTNSRIFNLRNNFICPYDYDYPYAKKYERCGKIQGRGRFPGKSWKYYRGKQWR